MAEILAPTLAAAHARFAAVSPVSYARARNALDGAVSGLSPYITHGFVTLAEVRDGIAARQPLNSRDKFVFELGWRAYFRHVWRHHGDAILQSLNEGPLPDTAYVHELPADADWLHGHLLDGDLASNHLSWQWVAGTGSQKPYLLQRGQRGSPCAQGMAPPWRGDRPVL